MKKKRNKIYKSSDLFLCPQSPMLIKVSIKVLDRPKQRKKNGCKCCNEIASEWLVESISQAFAQENS